ncbi:MAG: AbrB family transcriptional regulator, partial [Acidobacteria bacterium]
MNKVETTTTIKGQIVIPVEIRRKLGIKEGTRIRIELDEKGKQIILKPITRETIQALRGKYRDTASLKSLIEDRKWE